MLTLKSIANGRLVKSNTNISIRLNEYHQCIINTNSVVSIHRMNQSTSSCLLKLSKKRSKISQFKEVYNKYFKTSN